MGVSINELFLLSIMFSWLEEGFFRKKLSLADLGVASSLFCFELEVTLCLPLYSLEENLSRLLEPDREFDISTCVLLKPFSFAWSALKLILLGVIELPSLCRLKSSRES